MRFVFRLISVCVEAEALYRGIYVAVGAGLPGICAEFKLRPVESEIDIADTYKEFHSRAYTKPRYRLYLPGMVECKLGVSLGISGHVFYVVGGIGHTLLGDGEERLRNACLDIRTRGERDCVIAAECFETCGKDIYFGETPRRFLLLMFPITSEADMTGLVKSTVLPFTL